MRAIILCAGMATRLTPLSLYTHKALLPIKGKPLVEHTIEYLQSHGIIDITLVLGYKAENFFYLREKYKIKYRISNKWRTHNNYSSMQLVFDKFKDVLVIDGDLHIVEDFIPFLDTSKHQFFVQPITHGTEWIAVCNDAMRIIDVVPNQTTGLGLLGLSYWADNDDLERIKNNINTSGPSNYWDEAAYALLKDIPIYAFYTGKEHAHEFDSLQDLILFSEKSKQEIAELCSQNGTAKEIASNAFEILHSGKTAFLIFNGVTTELRIQ